jgi:hypothetical protein
LTTEQLSTLGENKMARQANSPEAQVIIQFNALPEDSKGIVLDVLKSLTRPKSTAPVVTKRSKDKPAASPGITACAICGHTTAYQDHDPESENYHRFQTEIKKKKSKVNSGVVLPDNPDDFDPVNAEAANQ